MTTHHDIQPVPVRLVKDATAIDAAMDEVASLVSASVGVSEDVAQAARDICQSLLTDLADHGVKAFEYVLRLVPDATPGADGLVVRLEPGDRFLDALTALRALQTDNGIGTQHGDSSQDGSMSTSHPERSASRLQGGGAA